MIGAGPAGIAAALELADQGLTVALIESGSESYDPQVQSLSDANISSVDSHSVMHEAVRRGLGGTSALWGGRCVPLDDADFVQRDFVLHSGWPITSAELRPFYKKASEFLGVGDAAFDIGLCNSLQTKAQLLSAKFDNSDEVCATTLERWSCKPNAWLAHKARLALLPRIKVMPSLTCVGFQHAQIGQSVSEVFVRNTAIDESQVRSVKALAFVIACGGVESTRLVLNSIKNPTGLKLESAQLVGCYYMGHPSGKIANIEMSGDAEKTLYGFERDGDVYVRRRITIKYGTAQKEQLLNIAFWLDNAPLPDWRHGSGVLSAAYLALTTPWLGSLLAPAAIKNRAIGSDKVQRFPHLINCLRSPWATVAFCTKFFYQRYIAKPRVPGFFTFSSNNRYALHYHAEQVPNEKSTISLSADTDKHGMNKANISLVWSQQDVDSIIRAHEVLDDALQKNNIGKLTYRYPTDGLRSAIVEQAVDGFHQIGTLRMSANPSLGVTDEYGRLYGTSNCYVASSAIFPTSGQANPTLALVALTIRQARHIVQQLPSLRLQHA